jgi:hypothetical protein
MRRSCWTSIVPLVAVIAAMTCVPIAAVGQPIAIRGNFARAGGQPGQVGLPYRMMQADAQGNGYFIYQGGWFQQQGNIPQYSEGAMMMVNGATPNMTNNLAKLDANGELVLENMNTQHPGVTVTRRLLVDHDNGWVRIVDVFKNSTNAAVNLPVTYRTSLNYGVTSVQQIGQGGGRKSADAVVAVDGRNRGALEWFGGRGAKVAPQITAVPNNNNVMTSVTLTIPAGKEVALLHLHAPAATVDAATKIAAGIKESKLLSSLPKEIRKLVVNLGAGNLFIGDGDIELLRGEAFDAAEMRGGDMLHGTLKEKSYKLNTFYGPVELPADKVISLVNIGESRPRQLLVTTDGEIFGGRLDKDTIDLELSSGQVTKLPLSQITRLGYRKRPGERDEWALDKPMVMLRTGERIAIQPPTEDITVATRYGTLKLAPAIIASVAFQNEDNGVHEIYLTDGSRFAGLVNAPSFDLKLGDSPDQTVKIPTSTLMKLQLTTKGDEDGNDAGGPTPTLKLANEDLLVGTVTGQYKLETTFDTLTLDGQQIKSIVHSRTSPLDVVVKLWDDTSVGGQLAEQELTCQLKSGVTMKVPVALVAEYAQPQPKPADAMTEKVKQIVSHLNADDFKVREEAQRQLISLGASIAPILKELRNDQPVEAKQRIDSVLQALKVPGAGAQPDN